MEKLKMQTTNVVDENIKRIGEMFPNCLTEVKDENGRPLTAIDFDQLRQELSKDIVEGPEERYQFTWPDKRNAIRLANAPTTDTLRPCREESVDFDNTQNLYIEGDNLQVLKLLRENYLGKVKMIYIDPPYNTGKDFVYNDDYRQGTDEYVHNSGQEDEEGNRLVVNTESNGRFHTDWLNMIYPRLKVAKDLLTDDGILFASIGEHEVANLKRILVDIFGPDNYIESYIWESTFRPDNSSKVMRRNAEYVLCVARKQTAITALRGLTKAKEGLPSLTKSSMKESILRFKGGVVKALFADGKYKAGRRDSYELLDDVEVKDGLIITDFRLKGHVIWGQSNLDSEINNGTEIIIKNDSFVPYTKKTGDSIMAPTKLIPPQIVGDILSANAEMSALFPDKVFSYPKPVTLIEYLLGYIEDTDSIFMDFFSGSATSAHAIFKYNVQNKTNRKFILVQLPEDLDKNYEAASDKEKVVLINAVKLCDKMQVPHKLTEIGKERIRRAGKKIKEENTLTSQNLDTGFRVLKLDSSNMSDVFYTPEAFTERDLFEDNIKGDRTDEDLLFQTMIELGIELSAKIEKKSIAGKTVWSVSDGYLMACFDKDVNETTIKEIAKMKPFYFVMRDSSMATDNVADNFEQIWSEYSNETVRRIL